MGTRKSGWKSRKLWLGLICFAVNLAGAVFGFEVPVQATVGLLSALGAEGLADSLGALPGKRHEQP